MSYGDIFLTNFPKEDIQEIAIFRRKSVSNPFQPLDLSNVRVKRHVVDPRGAEGLINFFWHPSTEPKKREELD